METQDLASISPDELMRRIENYAFDERLPKQVNDRMACRKFALETARSHVGGSNERDCLVLARRMDEFMREHWAYEALRDAAGSALQIACLDTPDGQDPLPKATRMFSFLLTGAVAVAQPAGAASSPASPADGNAHAAISTGDAEPSIGVVVALENQFSPLIETALTDVVLDLRRTWITPGPARFWHQLCLIRKVAGNDLDKRVIRTLIDGFCQFSDLLCGFEVFVRELERGGLVTEERLLSLEQLLVQRRHFFSDEVEVPQADQLGNDAGRHA
ncbi:MAG: hypothetical protein LBI48_13125 [Burkholderiaceae bacterium]|jgi:hypothetical protein|nr:hypothetical protein [Burkholderiaceae bacterium]